MEPTLIAMDLVAIAYDLWEVCPLTRTGDFKQAVKGNDPGYKTLISLVIICHHTSFPQ